MRHHHREHHRRMHQRWWAQNPLAYVGMRLHRRLFFMVGASIVLSVVVGGAVTHFTSGATTWNHEMARWESTVEGEFARVWDSTADRDALAARLARGLDVQLELDDPENAVLWPQERVCADPVIRAPIAREGKALGSLAVCSERLRPHPSHWLFPLLAVVLVIWITAGRLARRMLRPLSMVVRVAEDLGAGKLESRADLDRYHYGEERILAESINRMADRVQRQMSDQRELLAAVSHELRTPLGHLRLLIEMARDGAATPKTFDDLDQEVSEIDHLVGDLLANSRLNFTALSVLPLDGADLAKRALERAGLPATLLDAQGEVHFQGDATLLSRALANLLDNARAHGGGPDALRVRRDGEAVRFEVDDHGPGFAPGDEQRAFEPFFQRTHGASGTGHAGSLGLGLALVQRIAQAHGGSAEVTNRPEGGARVAFRINTTPPSIAPAPA